MILAVTAQPDTTVLAAFAVGVLSFVSPCVLPLVPGYLSAISGVSMAEIRTGERRTWQAAAAEPDLLRLVHADVRPARDGGDEARLVARHPSRDDQHDRRLVDHRARRVLPADAGLPFLNKEWRPDALIRRAGTGGPIVAGLAFAVAWTPCAGPTLGSILGVASTSSTVYHGGVLLAFYSAGLAVPFLLCALGFDRLTTTFSWIRNHYLWVTAVGGVFLIATGVMLLTGTFAHLNADAQKALDSLGLDFFKNV